MLTPIVRNVYKVWLRELSVKSRLNRTVLLSLVDARVCTKYTIQVTVANERDEALSGSTLKEIHSWGKVNITTEQIVFSEMSFEMVKSVYPKRFNWPRCVSP
ncbi:deoxyhypusine synthase family protein (plasmid) [Trichormus variabilis ARAD]|nr:MULTISPECIES: deoxyhypusine synthase family protein [Nostocaceae]MBC1218010.1 deoxyhypusine synthase family protein [Trichormus variabilis ARAD]MBC1259243.1 deoxyhypusine synthase family protein [Trichormus variabilis V5]MBC1270776.1 deoxyhypusine synthase family protein [Trichormus variabilis FSR]MBC1305693.1 deoxyhypusine synthase family protein [Trichormus variabilis N2B]MBC1314635.1 deoxyhypusine synthase family protein [Trichormus variabilis PNB]MBC1329990.1 deoxyhypusine synthase fam